MLTVIFNEAELNQVKAALDERISRLERQVAAVQRGADRFPDIDLSRAIVWTNDAILQCRQARDILGDPQVPEQADSVTAAKAYHDWQAAGPVR